MDEDVLRQNIQAYQEVGMEAIYLLGTSGELFNISPAEYWRAVQIFVQEAGTNVLKVVGCASARLGESVETVEWLADAGADCVLTIPPYFIPLAAEERTAALRSIARACPSLGVVHYNTDYAPGVKFAPEDYAHLLDLPTSGERNRGH